MAKHRSYFDRVCRLEALAPLMLVLTLMLVAVLTGSREREGDVGEFSYARTRMDIERT